MQFAFRTALAVVGLALLLVPPSVSQDQCNLPTDQDVTEVVKAIFATILPEGTAPPTVEELFQVHFTCLATVALDMYASATVVANFTTTGSSESTVEQFQLRCFSGGVWGASPSSGFKDQANLPAMPFAIEEQDQCYRCEELSPSTPNYDSDSNCQFCAAECLEVGGGFCTGDTDGDCCPVFNSETGACMDNCTVIDPEFGPDENFICECIPCDPGYTQNSTDCSCELTDGCEASEQPCQNGGTCISDVSAPGGGPYYNCTCAIGFSGINCTECIPCDSGYTQNSTDCSCELIDGCEAAGQPCHNGGTCISDISAPGGGPYYNCTCSTGFSGNNCTVCIPCDPGYMLDTTTCSCELTDGCEAAGQPCQNGGTCVSDLSAPAGGPYYNCTCDNGFYGPNCAMPSSTMATTTLTMATTTVTMATTTTTTTPISTTATPTIPSEDSGTPTWIIIVPVVLFIAITTILFIVLIVIILYRRSQRSMKHSLTSDGYASKNPDIDVTLKEID